MSEENLDHELNRLFGKEDPEVKLLEIMTDPRKVDEELIPFLNGRLIKQDVHSLLLTIKLIRGIQLSDAEAIRFSQESLDRHRRMISGHNEFLAQIFDRLGNQSEMADRILRLEKIAENVSYVPKDMMNLDAFVPVQETEAPNPLIRPDNAFKLYFRDSEKEVGLRQHVNTSKFNENLNATRYFESLNEIVYHCSATRPKWLQTNGIPHAIHQFQEIRSWHVDDNKWNDIGYHFLILRDGSVLTCRPLHVQGAHVKSKNPRKIGICLIGGFGSTQNDKFKDNFTDAQFEAATKLNLELFSLIPSLEMITGHNHYANKACPGFKVNDVFVTPN